MNGIQVSPSVLGVTSCVEHNMYFRFTPITPNSIVHAAVSQMLSRGHVCVFDKWYVIKIGTRASQRCLRRDFRVSTPSVLETTVNPNLRQIPLVRIEYIHKHTHVSAPFDSDWDWHSQRLNSTVGAPSHGRRLPPRQLPWWDPALFH